MIKLIPQEKIDKLYREIEKEWKRIGDMNFGFGVRLARQFFEKRFERKPEEDKAYFDEWENRFLTGHPETYMDFESLQVYLEILRGIKNGN